MANKTKIEVSDAYRVVFLDSDFNPVDEDRAELVKITNQGQVTFAVLSPDDVQANAFEGHRGRPGKRGGSLPRSAGTGPTPESIKRIYQGKIKNEPAITKDMQALSGESKGRLAGLNSRLKTEESFSRKVKSEAAENGISLEEAAGQITDAVRYTMVFDSPEEFSNSVRTTENKLLEKGYTRYDHKRRNYFGATFGDGTYEGYNTVWVSPGGETFELQFHTEQSLKIKSINHDIYKIARQSTDQAERARLVQQMIDNWRSPEYKRPANYQSLSTGD